MIALFGFFLRWFTVRHEILNLGFAAVDIIHVRCDQRRAEVIHTRGA